MKGQGSNAVAIFWKTPDLVRVLLDHCTHPHFLAVRAVNTTARKASTKSLGYWLNYLQIKGPHKRGEMTILKTVPLHLQVLQLEARRAFKAACTNLYVVELRAQYAEQRALLYRRHAERVFASTPATKRAIDHVLHEVAERKRNKIDISNINE